MRYIKTFESWSNDILPVGTKIKFDGKDCEIINHKSNVHNDIFYLIRYSDGQEEFVAPKDKRIEKVF
mgnify:CR=1 FL=1|jgi:hypothetical protein